MTPRASMYCCLPIRAATGLKAKQANKYRERDKEGPTYAKITPKWPQVMPATS